MEKLIYSLMKKLKKFNNFVNEDINDVHDVFEIINDMERKVLYDIVTGKTTILRKIKPSQYQKALDEMMKFNYIDKFPVKYIFRWKKLVIENMGILMAVNGIYGHGNMDMETFHDIFNTLEGSYDSEGGEFDKWLIDKGEEPKDNRYNWTEMFEFLEEEYKLDDIIPKYTNGFPLISDYGLETIGKRKGISDLVFEMTPQQDPVDILISINKILDVSHQRSDLAELFIEGGSKSLDVISG